jgi:hypothetical protein
LAVQMTEAFASAVTVTVPILALAAGAEARAVRDRLRRPDQEWEQKFEAHQAAHEFDPALPPPAALQYFKDVPGVSKAYVVERVLAITSAVVWLFVFVLLAITELLGLVWLADETGPGDAGLATFSVITIGLTLAALIMAPAVYLFLPVLLPFDLVPHGLKKALAPKLAGEEGRGFVKALLTELEGALDNAAAKIEREKNAADPDAPADDEPPTPA